MYILLTKENKQINTKLHKPEMKQQKHTKFYQKMKKITCLYLPIVSPHVTAL